MGAFGKLEYFVEARPTALELVLRGVCDLVSASRLAVVWKCPPIDAKIEFLPNGHALVEEEESVEDSELIGRLMVIEDGLRMASEYPLVSMDLKVEKSLPFAGAIARDIPPDIRGDAYVQTPTICIGPRHLYQQGWWEDDRESIYYGHAQFSVGLDGYGSPLNWDEYTRRIFEIPEFRKFQSDLEAILGPVKRCIVWSV